MTWIDRHIQEPPSTSERILIWTRDPVPRVILYSYRWVLIENADRRKEDFDYWMPVPQGPK
jgi:hypothetical protein